jgi:hypothetical protein
MGKKIQSLQEKLQKDGKQSYTTESAMRAIQNRIEEITQRDLGVDLLPLFENPVFIKNWIASFHSNFRKLVQFYLAPDKE